MARQASSEGVLSFGGDALVLSRLFEIGLDLALQLDGHRLAVAVEAAPGGNADPALRNRIFDDARFFLPVELDPDPAAQDGLVVKFAPGVERKAVGRAVIVLFGHARALAFRALEGQCKVSLSPPVAAFAIGD